MRNARQDELQARIKIDGRNINNLIYADDATLMGESEEELKSLLMRVKEVLKGVKPLVLYVVDRGVVMEPMHGKLASSQIDFGYTEQFCIPGVMNDEHA